MAKPLVLVVDDNAVNLMVLKKMLTRSGYEPLEAKDGIEAVRVVLERHPDVVLMDIMMPRMDGISAAREILERVKCPPRMIAVTGASVEKVRDDCLAAGMEAVVVKPVNKSDLLAMIERVDVSPPT